MNFLCIRRIIKYELEFLNQKFRFYQLLYLILSIIAAVIINLSSVKAFFSEAHLLIPVDWDLTKDSDYLFAISIIIIGAPSFVLLIINNASKSKEINDLSEAVDQCIIPYLKKELTSLRASLKRSHKLDDNIRLSIFVPVRKGPFRWNFQMICRTDDETDTELTASLRLDEGVVGYIFLNTPNQHHIDFIDLSGSKPLPSRYRRLSKNNQLLINREIKGIIGAASVQKGFISGVLAIDTDNPQNLSKMEVLKLQKLQNSVSNWIIKKGLTIKLLWRIKNHV